MSGKIVTIGNPVFDLIQTLTKKTDTCVLSGCSTNAALALAKLNIAVTFIGAIGTDQKASLLAQLDALGINKVLYPSTETGGFSLNYYDDQGNRTLDLLGRADSLPDIDPDEYAEALAVLLGPILGEISLGQIHTIRDNYGGLLFCDPQGLLRTVDSDNRIQHVKPDGIEQALGACTIVKPNELEGKILTGIDCRRDPYQAAKVIQQWGSQFVIVTLAELGSVIYNGYQHFDIPPYQVDLVDSTGAGDTYMAGFVYNYLRTKDLIQAGCFASAVASIMIEYIGPDFILTLEEVEKRQQSLLEQVQRSFKINLA